MSKGTNVVVVSGNVGNVVFANTRTRGDRVCSFTLAIEKAINNTTWARINVYGGSVEACDKFLTKGTYVVVEGELMNRHHKLKDDKVLEIKCKDIKFL